MFRCQLLSILRCVIAGTVGAMTVFADSMAAADGWPSNPDSPLVLGDMLGINNAHAVALSPGNTFWSAWFEQECFGSLYIQRVDAQGNAFSNGPIQLFTTSGCVGREARLAACAGGDVIVGVTLGGQNAGGSLAIQPITRLDPSGASVWPAPIVLAPPLNNPGGQTGRVGQLLSTANEDAVIAWHAGTVVFVSRYNAGGEEVWNAPAAITTLTGPTKRIMALIETGARDFIVVWDEPGGPYVRSLWAALVSATGKVLWSQPTNLAPTVSGSSRHTDPAAISDGAGGAIVVYTQGHEQSESPMPLRMQRVALDGSLLFEAEGRRVSLDSLRQFDAVLTFEPVTGDVVVIWRAGNATQSIRAQRLTINGDRLWSDTGILVKNLTQAGFGHDFDAVVAARNGELRVMIVLDDLPPPQDPNPARLRLHHVDLTGAVDAQSHPISGNAMVSNVRCVGFNSGFMASWLLDAPSFPDHVVAQRVNGDGSIGLPVIPGDVNGDTVVNVLDLLIVVNAWGACAQPCPPCTADVNSDCNVNVVDLLTVIAHWG